ncbi:hypothetical protein [Acidithiobacillus sp. HP-2]|uniref:hypothetical protein n=1 Tax=Acidithiobacillus sp. HP-2 TaxID=2697654 RepID=UPI001879F68A|nr:hypothetical protein [Acidithiobacillus sp. HP-2]
MSLPMAKSMSIRSLGASKWSGATEYWYTSMLTMVLSQIGSLGMPVSSSRFGNPDPTPLALNLLLPFAGYR